MSATSLAQRIETAHNPNEPAWYAVQIRRRLEKKLDWELGRKGIQTFLPLIRRVRRWNDPQKTLSIPLFPGYIFVRLILDTKYRLLVLQTPGVIGFVGPHEGPTAVPNDQIETLQRLLSSNTPCSMRPFLRAGQRVRIRDGALDGLQGILQEPDGKHLVISIDCIQRAVAIEVEGYDLEAA